MKPYINTKKCYADPNICSVIMNCTQNAITCIKDDQEPSGARIVFDYNNCLGCGVCEKECCGGAIYLAGQNDQIGLAL